MSPSKRRILYAALVLIVLAYFYKHLTFRGKIRLPIPYVVDSRQEIKVRGSLLGENIHTKTMTPHAKVMLKTECKLPGFKTKEQCQRINKSYKSRNCSYNCNCYPYKATDLPGEYSEPLLLPRQDMVYMEAITLHDPEFTDIMDSASFEMSKAWLLNPNQKLRVGDTFKVIIQLFDWAGRPRHVGGDDIRVWMVSLNKQANLSVAGNVVDFSNGTYVATITALWDGRSTINVKLAHVREEIATKLRWLRQYRVVFHHEGIFNNFGLKEITVCGYFPMENWKICNFTTLNGGQPWYCKKPSKLNCEDIDIFQSYGIKPIPFTDAQRDVIMNRPQSKRLLKTKLTVNIRKGIFPQQNVNCNRLNTRKTWDTRMPTGYVNGSQWIPLNCKNTLSIASLKSCLTNTNLIFMGDSTTRQYYTYLVQKIFTDCHQVTEKWKSLKWHEPTKCVSQTKNLSILWNPHELPFSDAKRVGLRTNLKSTEEILDGLDFSQTVVFVIHYYLHAYRSHYSHLIHKLRHIKPIIRKFLQQKRKVKLVIKSPHAFNEFVCQHQLTDLHGPIYIELIKRELQEFQDSIVYGNMWEMSVAFECHFRHPDYKVLWQNLRLLFGYICG